MAGKTGVADFRAGINVADDDAAAVHSVLLPDAVRLDLTHAPTHRIQRVRVGAVGIHVFDFGKIGREGFDQAGRGDDAHGIENPQGTDQSQFAAFMSGFQRRHQARTHFGEARLKCAHDKSAALRHRQTLRDRIEFIHRNAAAEVENGGNLLFAGGGGQHVLERRRLNRCLNCLGAQQAWQEKKDGEQRSGSKRTPAPIRSAHGGIQHETLLRDGKDVCPTKTQSTRIVAFCVGVVYIS